MAGPTADAAAAGTVASAAPGTASGTVTGPAPDTADAGTGTADAEAALGTALGKASGTAAGTVAGTTPDTADAAPDTTVAGTAPGVASGTVAGAAPDAAGATPGAAGTVAGPGGAVGVLARCREVVRPGLVEAVGQLDPWTGEMAAYALGWRDTSGAADPSASEGKGLRQALAVLSAEAVGARGRVAIPAAVAVELVHAFSLVHDDIMDGDPVRRRRAAVWCSYGVGPAVLAGDALHALAVRTLAETPGERASAAVRRLSVALTSLVRGQADDLRFACLPWQGPGAVGPAAYRVMAEQKTGSLLGCAAALGAELGGAPTATVEAFDRAGRHLGVAFQVVDDLLGVWGDPKVTGKPVHGDLRHRKKTYPVLAALTGDSPAARELAALLDSTEPLEGENASRAAALTEEAGGRAAARKQTRKQLQAARTCLTGIRLAPIPATQWETLITYLLDRTS